MVRGSKADAQRLAGIVTSYVRTHRSGEQLRQGLGDLHAYLLHEGFPRLPPEEVERLVMGHWSALENEARRVREEAGLLSPGHAPRPVRYRHGSAFCAACRTYKDYRKECPFCGHLEMTT